MGGIGSGRSYHLGAKYTVDSSISVDVHYLKKQGLLFPGRSGTLSWSKNGQHTSTIGFSVTDDGLMLRYNSDGESIRYTVSIMYSACNYGGHRPWLQCPGCRQRVGKLTLSGKIFACRNCGNMAYESQRENTQHRLLHKAQILRKRLGASLSVLDPIPWKPKGMHWNTYWRMRDQIEIYELEMLGAVSASMSAFAKKLTGTR